MRRRITTAGNSAALVLSQDVLGLMGVHVGDEVDVSLVDRTLVVRPIEEQDRDLRVAAAIDEVFRTRGALLGRLARAEGAGTVTHAGTRRKGRTPRR
jgi:antitoxin component of MazEF toxin-antitoxin module